MARLTYEAVQKQIAKLQAQAKALEAQKDARKARAVERVRALMKKLGVEVSDLEVPAPARRSRSTAGRAGNVASPKARKPARAGKQGGTVPPKYRDPDSGATWSGRGRTPVWLAKKLEEGKSREDFAIRAGESG